jgi:hypothetical protein
MTNSGKARWILVFAVVLVFAITTPLMIRAWRYKRSFDATLKQYLTEVQREDYRAAYSQSGEEFRAATPYEGFVRVYRSLVSSNGRLTKIEQGQTVVEGRGDPAMWVGVARVKAQFERTSKTLVYEFHYKNGGWKLYGFNDGRSVENHR